MVLFPEGGFLRKRREISQRYALKNNLPILENVSLPRTGAMQTILEEMANPEKSSSLSNSSKYELFVKRPGRRIHVNTHSNIHSL